MEKSGDRTTMFKFGGLRDRQRDNVDWVLKASLDEDMATKDVLTDEASTLLAAKLKTPLQIGQHLVCAFEAGFSSGTNRALGCTVRVRLTDRAPILQQPALGLIAHLREGAGAAISAFWKATLC